LEELSFIEKDVRLGKLASVVCIRCLQVKFKDISLQGFYSFSSTEPVVFDELSDVNFFIGPNNAGKSVLARFLYLVRQKIDYVNGVGSKLYRRNTLEQPVGMVVHTEMWWDQKVVAGSPIKGVFICVLNDEEIKSLSAKKDRLELVHEEEIRFSIYIRKRSDKDESELYVIPDIFVEGIGWRPAFELTAVAKEPQSFLQADGTYGKEDNASWYRTQFGAFLQKWQTSIRIFDAVRSLTRASGGEYKEYTDGSGVVAELYEWSLAKKDKAIAWESFRKTMVKRLNTLLLPTATNAVQDFALKGTSKEDAALAFTVNDRLLSASSLGSGISQLFLLLFAMGIDANKDQCHYFLEEPENNLHPGLLRRLLKLLSEQRRIQFFVASHSNVFLDSLRAEDRVFQIQLTDKGHTTVRTCKETAALSELLDSLGINASGLLQSNCAIWVEGPSDRIYVAEWLDQFATESKLDPVIQGSDYSFAEYGGKNLIHYELDYANGDPAEFISMLHLSRYSAVLMDRDIPATSKVEEIRGAKKKIIDDAAKDTKHRLAIITERREVEHELPLEQFTEAVANVLKLDAKTLSAFKLNDDSTFVKQLAAHLHPKDTDKEKSSANTISQRKVPIAVQIKKHCRNKKVLLTPFPKWIGPLYEFIISSRASD
jgi:predicted ATPase